MTKKKETMISIYDPSVDAFREVSVAIAKKFVESVKEVEAQLKEVDK